MVGANMVGGKHGGGKLANVIIDYDNKSYSIQYLID